MKLNKTIPWLSAATIASAMAIGQASDACLEERGGDGFFIPTRGLADHARVAQGVKMGNEGGMAFGIVSILAVVAGSVGVESGFGNVQADKGDVGIILLVLRVR